MPFSDKKVPCREEVVSGSGKGRTLSAERTHPFGENITTFSQKGRIQFIEIYPFLQKSTAYSRQNMPIFPHFCSFIEKQNA